jgi:hypothetical protein
VPGVGEEGHRADDEREHELDDQKAGEQAQRDPQVAPVRFPGRSRAVRMPAGTSVPAGAAVVMARRAVPDETAPPRSPLRERPVCIQRRTGQPGNRPVRLLVDRAVGLLDGQDSSCCRD